MEQAAQAAEARGLTSALISVGGNLRAIGTKPDGSQWVGGVENPWNSSEVYTNGSSTVAAVKMSDLSLVTSGDYQRYYVVDGVRYHHLIDPATLWPAAYFDGVSVLAPDSGVADCLTDVYKRQGADAAALGRGVEHAVAAVLTAAHDKVADEHLTAIGSHCHCNAAAGVLVGGQIIVQVDLFHVKFSYYGTPPVAYGDSPLGEGASSLPP